MSEITDTILAAIENGARTAAAIEEATGLERSQIYTGVHTLKQSGAVVRSDDGLTRSDGTAPKQKVRAAAPNVEVVAPPPARGKTRRKAKRTKRVTAKAAPRKPRVAASAPSRPTPVAFARFGEYVVVRHEDLAHLLAVLERWRAVLQA